MSEAQPIPEDIMRQARMSASSLGFLSYEERDALVSHFAKAIAAERINERVRMGMHMDRERADAAAAERERCAKIADDYSAAYSPETEYDDERAWRSDAAEDIAILIRRRA